MDGEGGYRPPIAETERNNPTQRMEANFIDGAATQISRNPNNPKSVDDYIARYIVGANQPYGAVELKEGLDIQTLSEEKRRDPQNYVFTFGAGELRQDDITRLGVPYAAKGRDALIAAHQRSKVKGEEPSTTATFTWGLDGGLPIRIRVSTAPYSDLRPESISFDGAVAIVPLVRPPGQEGQPVPPDLTGEDLIKSAVQKAKTEGPIPS